MTSPGTDAAALGAIIARTRYLLLDFDGPICSIFGGLPAPTVAEKLRKLFTGELPDEIANTPDPIEVFYYSATVSDEMAARVEAEMADLEVAAVPPPSPPRTSTKSSPVPATPAGSSASSATIAHARSTPT